MRVLLSDAFDLQMGKTPSRNTPQYWGGTNKWVSIADIGNSNKYINSTKECITDEGVKESGIKVVPKGTVIMSFKLSLGKTAITSEDMYTNEAIMAFIDKHKYSIDTDFLFHLLSGTDWSVGTNKAVLGLTLNKATLSQKQINIPPLPEQRHIAAVLDKVSELIALRKRQLDLLDEMVKARFVEMFGDPVTNPRNLPTNQLSNYILFLTSGSRGWAKYCGDTGKEWFITIKNVKNCNITTDNMQNISPPDNAEARRTKVQEGDLLISITADLGRTGVVTKEIAAHGAYINQHLTCIRINRSILNPIYVAYYMESEAGKQQFETQNQTGVKAGLNFNSINGLKLMIPNIDEQNLFDAFVQEINKSKATVQQGLDRLNLLKSALMQEYFG